MPDQPHTYDTSVLPFSVSINTHGDGTHALDISSTDQYSFRIPTLSTDQLWYLSQSITAHLRKLS